MASCHLSLAAGDSAGSSVLVNSRHSVMQQQESVPQAQLKDLMDFNANRNGESTSLQTNVYRKSALSAPFAQILY